MPQESLDKFLRKILPELDEISARAGLAVSERPMKVAQHIAEDLVIEVSEGTKENYMVQPWFAAIFITVQKWFIARYGEAQVHPKREVFGAIKHFEAMYLLQIPLTLVEPQGDDTLWLTFAKDILPGENVLLWIINGPSTEMLKAHQLDKLRKDISDVASMVRSISNDLITAEFPEGAQRAMAGSILRHLSKAASDMCSLNHESTSLVVWELVQACEKAMKVYLSQEGVDYPLTHDLRVLLKITPAKYDWSDVKAALRVFPSESRMMKWRHQEIESPLIADLWRYYMAALKITSIYTSRISRQYHFNNFKVHLRKPPWIGGKLEGKSDK